MIGAPLFRPFVIFVGLLAGWQAIVIALGLPRFILPGPLEVGSTLFRQADKILPHLWITLSEIGIGLVLGTVLGTCSALVMAYFTPLRRWLMPVLVVSQAIPVFALAPILVLWFGYGVASKAAMATLIIYFPVTAAFFDGLRRTEPGWLDLAHTMNGSRWAVLRQVRIPAALPAFASGLRVAAAVAPIGAVVGEWVGSSAGLGYLMLHANARMQVDLMFAALFTLAVSAVVLYFALDTLLRRAISWQHESEPSEEV